jgi:hypothetical protein
MEVELPAAAVYMLIPVSHNTIVPARPYRLKKNEWLYICFGLR